MSARKFTLRSHSFAARSVSNKWKTQTCAHPMMYGTLHVNTESTSSLDPIPEADHLMSQAGHADQVVEDEVAKTIQDAEFRVVIDEVLSSYLKEFAEYDHEICGRLCKLISDLIKCRIEEVCEEQYKITVNVFIGAIRGEGIEAASQCTWTPECDRFATASYKNDSLFAVGIVFAMYNN